jgi:hypothetical protein
MSWLTAFSVLGLSNVFTAGILEIVRMFNVG